MRNKFYYFIYAYCLAWQIYILIFMSNFLSESIFYYNALVFLAAAIMIIEAIVCYRIFLRRYNMTIFDLIVLDLAVIFHTFSITYAAITSFNACGRIPGIIDYENIIYILLLLIGKYMALAPHLNCPNNFSMISNV